jgi:glycosyltransferase involved in cell wall biosynthesis
VNRKVTLCLPYYMNKGMLAKYLDSIEAMPLNVREGIAVIVVDDGSPDGDAVGRPIGCPLEIYKIGVDIRWNQDAARNIAAHHADTLWLLLTDIDHMVPVETFEMILREKLKKTTAYRFSRVTLEQPGAKPQVTPYKPHPNSWLMRRELFWYMGGYDERFAGYYGTDADFRNRINAVAMDVKMLPEVLIRVPRTVIPDASTTTYQRKAPEDRAGLDAVKRQREVQLNWKPQNFRFPYRRIYP